MVALAVTLLLAGPGSQNYPDRAKFLKALAALPEHAPVAAVINALGKPDRVENRSSEGETWLYGTDGLKGAATLAQLYIYQGKLGWHPVGEPPPPTTVISEVELRKGMHLVLNSRPDTDYNTKNTTYSKWVAETVNSLLPSGEAKCKAIIGECGRMVETYSLLDPSLFFLTYALFDPPAKPGYFDEFGPVWYVGPCKDHATQPRWPIEIIDDVPVIHGSPMGGFGGEAPTFADQYQRLRARIHLRKTPLSLPR